MFPGYFNDPVATAESFDEDGWYKTQDIVEVFPNGSI
jgi:long-subunit acyl-CoA synthetase (AMP-forming)